MEYDFLVILWNKRKVFQHRLKIVCLLFFTFSPLRNAQDCLHMSKITTNAVHYNGHRERLKKRFLREVQHVEDYEILELLLYYGVPRKDTKPLAKNLLAHFGTLRRVLDAKKEELQSIDGFGTGLWTLWLVLRECMARHAASPLVENKEIVTSAMVARMAQKRLAGSSIEACWIVLVDTNRRCLSWECLKKGNIKYIPLTPRDILARACTCNANGFVLVHNHPSGNTYASREDNILTTELKLLAPRMELEFIDHIIITEASCYGMLSKQYF